MTKKQKRDAYETLLKALHKTTNKDKYAYIRMLQDIGVYINVVS